MLVACTDLYTRGSCSVTATWPRSGPPYSPSSPPPRSSSTIRYHLYDHELFTADPADTEPGLDPDEADAVVFVGLVHQLCTQHIYPDQAWPVQIADALRGLVHHTNTTRHDTALATGDGHDPAHCRHCQPTGPAVPLDELRRRFRQGVLVGLAHTTDHGIRPGERPARLLLETLHTREDDVLRFLTDPTIPPTSNDAERALRPAKIQQNISGRLTSETVTQDRYTILGYLSTAAKHGLDIMTALRQTFGGRP
ncbi:transposase [Frankia sp. CiP3]|uniref:IS66 family transposase n=1 Tax=Frankia sp. CiP3 TaxID=2880971 RepID=UPI0021030497|nr:transposase [Frankia sp. CiP3]